MQIPQFSQPPDLHKTNICRRPDVNPSNTSQQVFSASSLLLFLSLFSHKHSCWFYLARWCSEVSLQMLRAHLGDVPELRAAPKAGISWLLCPRKQVSPPGRPVLGWITHPPGLRISTLTPEQPAADHRPVFLTIKPSSLILILPLTLVVRSQGLLPADVFPGEQGGLFCPAATPELPGEVWDAAGAQSDCATLVHTVTMVTPCFQLGRELPYTEPERDTHIHVHRWVPRCMFSSAANPSERVMRWLRGILSRLVSLPQCQALDQHWAGSSTLSSPLDGDSSCRSNLWCNCSVQLWNTFSLQTVVSPQRKSSRLPREDVTMQDPRIVKGFNPNVWRSQPVGSWRRDTGAKPLLGLWCSEIFLAIPVSWMLWWGTI